MEHDGVPAEEEQPTPLFGAYRRGGYDPDQVDRYVAEQARRLDDALHRASEAERRLAAAVGQLRELHRRVAVLESEERSPQPPPLDTLGERVQRILQEAWEGAYALRQGAEQEVADVRERAGAEAEEIVAAAEARARAVDQEIERRRKAYLARLEEDRSRAVAQVSYLHEQRKVALSELLRVKEVIEVTVGEAAASRAASATGGGGTGGLEATEPGAAVPSPGVPVRSGSLVPGSSAGPAGPATEEPELELGLEPPRRVVVTERSAPGETPPTAQEREEDPEGATMQDRRLLVRAQRAQAEAPSRVRSLPDPEEEPPPPAATETGTTRAARAAHPAAEPPRAVAEVPQPVQPPPGVFDFEEE